MVGVQGGVDLVAMYLDKGAAGTEKLQSQQFAGKVSNERGDGIAKYIYTIIDEAVVAPL